MRTTYAVLMLPFLAACHATGGERDLGRVPQDVVDLYDVAARDGLIEIELERDGRIREMEAQIALTEVPQVAADAAMAFLPAGRVTGAEREITRFGVAYEVDFEVGGLAWEVVVDEHGTIVETEQQLDPRAAPKVVIDAANRTIKDGVLKSVELVTRGGVSVYHVKKDVLGVSYKLEIAADGTVERKVREARAEIEIPLAEER
ncbi:MAG: hypothetical protein R3F34_00475 [Planctomycetota bacterium]